MHYQAPIAPDGVANFRYTIRYESEEGNTGSVTFSRRLVGEEHTYTLVSLVRDTEYSVQIRIGVSSSVCLYSYDYGNYSDPVTFRTNETCELICIKQAKF